MTTKEILVELRHIPKELPIEFENLQIFLDGSYWEENEEMFFGVDKENGISTKRIIEILKNEKANNRINNNTKVFVGTKRFEIAKIRQESNKVVFVINNCKKS